MGAAVTFVPLRCHSWFSLLEGVSSPEALLARAAEMSYPALAITDTNNLYGAVGFLEAARRYPSVRPILGAHLRHAAQSCTVLVAEPAGYRSLCRAISRLHLTSPLSLAKVLAENHEGLLALVDDAALVRPLHEVFRERLWMEVVRPGRPEAEERALLEAGRPLGVKPVASCAPCFATPAGHDAYRLLAAVRGKTTLDRLPPRLAVTPEHHLAEPDAVFDLFADLAEAVTNTEAVANCCRSDVLPRGHVQPPARVPEGQDAPGYLRLLCERALPGKEWVDAREARGRLEAELRIVCQRDLAPYFLVCHEIAREARQNGWPMALRGSAGSSLVCFLLGITDIDPLRHGLRLDRFLHPGRADLPDIDLDFDAGVRPKVIEWVVARYGPEHVARVGMLERLGVRGAFWAAAKAHGLGGPQVAELLDALGPRVEAAGEDAGALTEAPPASPLEPERWPALVASVRLLTGRPQRWSAHPSGLFLTPGPAEDHAPLERRYGKALAQFDKDAVERTGLVKIDVLSNRALSALSEARAIIKALGDEASPPEGDTDAATLELLGRGDTLGISQLETPSMRRLLAQLQPKGLPDLIQALALVRPGASGGKEAFLRRRRGVEPVRFPCPALEPVLKDQFGVLLYEDDVLAVVQALTGASAAAADRLRKRLCDAETAEEAAAAFVKLCDDAGVPRPAAEQVCGQLRRFSAYSFCKSHAVAYARIAWQEAWLKAHHPLPFWVAALNHATSVYPRRVYVEAVKRAGVPVLLPDVNASDRAFTQAVSGVRVGLAAVRGVDAEAAGAVLEDRRRRGPFASLADFQRRVPDAWTHRDRLIKAGCFDFTGRSRAALLREAGAADSPRLRLWVPGGEDSEPWPCEGAPRGYPLAGQWRGEWEALGFLGAGTPLMQVVRSGLGPEYQALPGSRVLPSLVGQHARVVGLAAAARRHPAASGEQVQFVTLEDEYGLFEVFAAGAEACAGLGPWVAEGVVEEQHGVPVLKADRLARALPGALPDAARPSPSVG